MNITPQNTPFKQTEIGPIPQDWEVAYLVDVSTKITDGEHITPLRTKYGYYLLSARNILNGSIALNDVDYVGTDEYNRIKQRCNPETGDILISCSGTIGRVTVVPFGIKCVLVRSAALIKQDRAKVNGLFIQYYLQSLGGQTQIFRSLNQGAQANLFLNHIEKLKAPIPPLPEQTAIATALSDADALIGGLEKLIHKKRLLKQATMQHLLTPKQDWEVKKLGEIGKFSKGQGIRKDESLSGDIPCVRYGEIYTRHTDYVKQFYSFISRGVAQTSKRLKFGDILFAGSGETKEEIGKAIAFVDEIEAYAGGDIVILSPTNTNSLFLGYLLNTPFVVKQKSSRGQGDAVVHISASNLTDVIIYLPPLAEQTRIATILSDMDAELSGLEGKLEKYRQLKQGMMQQLLTGKIRLV